MWDYVKLFLFIVINTKKNEYDVRSNHNQELVLIHMYLYIITISYLMGDKKKIGTIPKLQTI